MLVPDAIEPVVGWRSWRIRDGESGFELVSTSRRITWSAGSPIEAACDRGDGHRPPLAWRGRYAYPYELFVPAGVKHYRRGQDGVQIFDSEGLAAVLAERYGVTAVVTRSLLPVSLLELVAR